VELGLSHNLARLPQRIRERLLSKECFAQFKKHMTLIKTEDAGRVVYEMKGRATHESLGGVPTEREMYEFRRKVSWKFRGVYQVDRPGRKLTDFRFDDVPECR